MLFRQFTLEASLADAPVAMNAEVYFQKPIAAIIEDICGLAVPDHVLKDEGGWKRLCEIRGSNTQNVSTEQWLAICRLRFQLDNLVAS